MMVSEFVVWAPPQQNDKFILSVSFGSFNFAHRKNFRTLRMKFSAIPANITAVESFVSITKFCVGSIWESVLRSLKSFLPV